MKIKKISSDERRDIYLIENLLPKQKEFTIIKLKKGKAIGGCIHEKDDEYYVVLDGAISATIGELILFASTGIIGKIPKGCPHMFKALENSIICEWGVEASDKTKKDKNMRELVDSCNMKQNV